MSSTLRKSRLSQVVCVERSYVALEKLHAFLIKKHGTLNIPSFPVFPSPATDAKLAVLCGAVHESDEVHALVNEELAAGVAHMTAIDFILQPFEYEKVNILRGSKHELQLQVASAGQTLVWKFEVDDYDIEFYAEFHTPFPMYTEIFHAATKYQTTSKPVEVSMSLHKTVLYLAHVIGKDMMDSAFAAADALNQAMKEAGPTSGNCLHLQKSPVVKTSSGGRLPLAMPSLEQLTPQWLMDGLMHTTATYAARLFGSRRPPLTNTDAPSACENSLMQELNGLNMTLLQRVRLCRERQSWPAVVAERDALLLEKHRWAMFDGYADKIDPASLSPPREGNLHLKDDVRQALEKELGQAELTLLRVRAQLGYSLHQNVPVGSGGDRLERLAHDLAAAKTEFDDKMEHTVLHVAELNQQKVLVTELRNLKRETDGQVAVAIAEACEARMVNQSLKRQNELLLSQMRTIVDETNRAAAATNEAPEVSPLPSTITAADIALLNGQPESNKPLGRPANPY
ncbi:hypothetical protein DYB36_011318, partial [Aphanomyces astaci]